MANCTDSSYAAQSPWQKVYMMSLQVKVHALMMLVHSRDSGHIKLNEKLSSYICSW